MPPGAWASSCRQFGAGDGVFKMVAASSPTFAPLTLTPFGSGRSVQNQSILNAPRWRRSAEPGLPGSRRRPRSIARILEPAFRPPNQLVCGGEKPKFSPARKRLADTGLCQVSGKLLIEDRREATNSRALSDASLAYVVVFVIRQHTRLSGQPCRVVRGDRSSPQEVGCYSTHQERRSIQESVAPVLFAPDVSGLFMALLTSKWVQVRVGATRSCTIWGVCA